MRFIKTNVAWFLLLAIGVTIFFQIIRLPKYNWGGDIAEYYGTSESIINHLSPELTTDDQARLEKVLNPIVFKNPQYYLTSLDGSQYPVHFIFYSLINVPIILILKLFNLSELLTFRITNLFLLLFTVGYTMQVFLHNISQRIIFLLLLSLSPLVSFIIWPGPDLLIVCFLLLAVFYFFEGQYLLSSAFTILASWQSQPLIILVIVNLLFYIQHNLIIPRKIGFMKNWQGYLTLVALLVTAGLPYLLNLVVFGMVSPWPLIQDGWTKVYGFGLQNISLQKLFEQFFDFNIGLFWYYPVALLFGGYLLIKQSGIDKRLYYVLASILITAIMYQTNPAWNYGTGGYGPTRHILFVIPYLIYFCTLHIKLHRAFFLVIVYILTQLYILNFNGFLNPDFKASMRHTPYARYILDNFPELYNPTPEIFVDRTSNTDLLYPTSAIYVDHNVCKKAFVLKEDMSKLVQTCGYIPSQYARALQNSFPLRGMYITY